jgi:hypothetical protein
MRFPSKETVQNSLKNSGFACPVAAYDTHQSLLEGEIERGILLVVLQLKLSDNHGSGD